MNESLGILLVVIPLLVVIVVIITWHSFVGRLIEYVRSQRHAKKLGR